MESAGQSRPVEARKSGCVAGVCCHLGSVCPQQNRTGRSTTRSLVVPSLQCALLALGLATLLLMPVETEGKRFDRNYLHNLIAK